METKDIMKQTTIPRQEQNIRRTDGFALIGVGLERDDVTWDDLWGNTENDPKIHQPRENNRENCNKSNEQIKKLE